MTGPEDHRAAARRGPFRASHADREDAIEALKAAYVAGRLTEEEFEARVGQAFASRTRADLATITADIPAGMSAVPSARTPDRVVAAGTAAVIAAVSVTAALRATKRSALELAPAPQRRRSTLVPMRNGRAGSAVAWRDPSSPRL